MKVLKFGGTSVANAKSLINVIDIITQSKDQSSSSSFCFRWDN
jgi:aspartokinase